MHSSTFGTFLLENTRVHLGKTPVEGGVLKFINLKKLRNFSSGNIQPSDHIGNISAHPVSAKTARRHKFVNKTSATKCLVTRLTRLSAT